MSKRFGRNQKRAMRQDIYNLQEKLGVKNEALNMCQGLAAHMRTEIREQQEALDRVARVLGKHFFGLPAVKDRMSYLPEPYRMAAEASITRAFGAREVPELVTYATEQLQYLRSETLRNPITGAVHIELETPDGRRTYALSYQAWQEMKKDKDYMARIIAREVSQSLAEFIARETA